MHGVTAPAYALLDCGGGRRLERFGDVVVDRPAPAAVHPPALPPGRWREADLSYSREEGWRGTPPENWRVAFGAAVLALRPAGQGQLGAFPEHARVCDRLDALLAGAAPGGGVRALNLFAHTGLATLRLAARPEVAETTHVDAAGVAVRQARENAAASGLAEAGIRWIEDDALAFMRRELRRERRYGIILTDPPAFGRSRKGGEWKLERDLPRLLAAVDGLLVPQAGLFCLTCHREGWTAGALRGRVREALAGCREVETFDLALRPESGASPLPAGFAVLARR